jgi:hypothetical protein
VAASFSVIDLELYISASDVLQRFEEGGETRGGGEAARDWIEQQDLDREQKNYFYEGVARLRSDWKAEGWETKPRDERLDQFVWAYHRAWVDRYGWAPTNAAGIERFKSG